MFLFSHVQVYREVRIMKLVDHPNIGELNVLLTKGQVTLQR